MSPAFYRTFARIGALAQLAHVVGLVALVRALGRALEHAEKAVHGDIGLVTRELATARPVLAITGPIALAGFILLLVAVMKGNQRARWIFWVGLLASFFYVLVPVVLISLLGPLGLPLGFIPGMVGLFHFIGHRREYFRSDTHINTSPSAENTSRR
jgi:hypothetical protein